VPGPSGPAGSGGSEPSRVSSSAETPNEAALTPKAAAGPASPTSAPPSAGPTMIWRFSAVPSSALARDSRSAGTSRGTLLLPAGMNSAASSPARATSGSRTGSGGRNTASTPKMIPWPSSHPASSRRWSTRSAIAPASGPASAGTVAASSTALTAPGPAGVTSSTSAIRLAPVPAEEIVRLSHSQRNRGASRSSPGLRLT
jgi:hypothetical protein